ncbi:hypothetical protein DOTSEDRAFT_144911 [Dothistroma septosporum NZE10]|uniref:Uncharacterized protein n=1 Tax=Dothistroma septosporum (strain NZE10 / CBS 128990) TaxID=675120 RepID=N1Q4G3_DOTSN|nr:hypothetical protein DOTSEDRAFT_144911 [Dothistroma septosporum NZE10]
MDTAMSTKTSATLAWATPVRPDKLGEGLEAYAKAVPTLHALRLCHRFGQGFKVHITSVPTEIELAIEAFVITAAKVQIARDLRDSDDPSVPTWSSAFHHFESKCAPMDHLVDCYSPLNDQVFDDPMAFCDACEEDYWNTEGCKKACKAGIQELCWTCTQNADPESCHKTCNAMVHRRMNDLAIDWDWDRPEDSEDCERWRLMIDTKGRFAKYAETLHRHFGLNVQFIETRIATEDRAIWPRHLNHRYHEDEKLKTTLCYLILAQYLVPAKTFEPSDIEMEVGEAYYSTAQSLTVPRDVLSDLREADILKFRRAMNVLGLRPYLHRSQRGLSKAMRTPTTPTATITAGEPENDAANQSWPQLTFIVQSQAIA